MCFMFLNFVFKKKKQNEDILNKWFLVKLFREMSNSKLIKI